MAVYEAIINLTVQAIANDPDEADKIFYGRLTDELLNIGATPDSPFAVWMDIIEIEERH
jgi:hypothetical protein